MTDAAPTAAPRLVSLDAYRGFIMLAMASGGLGFVAVAQKLPESGLWAFLGEQFDHVPWTGCSFWDLIQPSFMFMVGVAMPYSHASRLVKGHSRVRIAGHVLFRAVVLILLGIFLDSNSSRLSGTDFTFVNVLTQIGMGYIFVYCLLGWGQTVQLVAVAVILAGYWYLFYQHPVAEPSMSLFLQHRVDFFGWEPGALFAHWNKCSNFAASFDQNFLELFPQSSSLPFNRGGYQTLNFVPSMATMIFGLIAGERLRGETSSRAKLAFLLVAGALLLAIGLGLNYTVCPSVKRIWTPSWAIYSTGWTFLILAAFFAIIDVIGFRWWSFPFVVVGVNSIAMYCMARLLPSWVAGSLERHFNLAWQSSLQSVQNEDAKVRLLANFGSSLFGGTYGPIVRSAAALFVLWLVCVWMYRKKIFLRI